MWELLDVGWLPSSLVCSDDRGSSWPTVHADLSFGPYIIKPAFHIVFSQSLHPLRSTLKEISKPEARYSLSLLVTKHEQNSPRYHLPARKYGCT